MTAEAEFRRAKGAIIDYYTYTIAPGAPAANQSVTVRIDSPDGCIHDHLSVVAGIEQRTITMFFTASDAIPAVCPSERVSPVVFPVGSFPRGTYTLEYVSCSNPIPPAPPCHMFASERFVVGGGDIVPVPTLGTIGLALLFGVCWWLARGCLPAR